MVSVEDIEAQHRAVVELTDAAELHALLLGLMLLRARRNSKARDWRAWMRESSIPTPRINAYIRRAEALEVVAHGRRR